MSGFAGSQPIILPKLGGLYTFLRPVDVPSGYSPNLQNVRFLPRAVLTRPGLTQKLTTSTLASAAQFINNSSVKTTLLLDAQGIMYRVDGNNNQQFLGNGGHAPEANPGSLMKVQQSFGREFMSYYNGPPNVSEPLAPGGPIRHWDGNIDPIPSAPTSPTAANDVVAGNITAGTHHLIVIFEMSYGLLGPPQATDVSWVASGTNAALITNIPLGPIGCVARRLAITTTTDPNTFWFLSAFKINDNLTTQLSINGSDFILTSQGYILKSPFVNTSLFIVPALAPLSPDGPGVAPNVIDSAAAGNVAIGVHQVQVIWETRWGYLTAPSPTTSWTATGSKKVTLSNIPVGPWYVIARRILFTLSGGADFFYITSNRIGDNTTTSIDLDFTDIILAAGSNFNYIARNFSPMDSYGVGVYGGRLVTWGGLNTVKGLNLGFDGGWDNNNGNGLPAGWNNSSSLVQGGVREFINVYCGEAWRIFGDGNFNIRGQIINNHVVSDINSGIPLLQPNTSYTVSVRLSGTSFVNGSNKFFVIELFSPTRGNGLLGQVLVPCNTITGNFTEFQGILLNSVASIPPDTQLRIYASGVLLATESIIVDHIRIWPTNQKYEGSVVRFSNPFDPETFDGVNGFIQVAKDNGEQVVACAQLRSFYYVFKERSMHTTYDDGSNPPSLWFTRSVDNTIGAGSPNGVTSSDTFIITHWRSGGYLYTGGRPLKVSQEVQTTWEKFAWQFAWKTHVLLDTQEKNIFFFGPMNADTAPKNILILDYSEGIGQEDDPAGRKWGLDLYNTQINASFKFENVNNSRSLYFVGNQLYEQVGIDDAGVPIDSFYETAFVKAGDHGQDVFLGTSFFAEGTGRLFVSLRGLDDVVIESLVKDIELTANPGKQFEMWGNLETERAKVRFETSVIDTNFTLKGVALYAIPNFFEQRPA
jgi:hypothetical protein